MVLLAYFKQANLKRQNKVDGILPKSNGLSSQILPVSCIEVANAAVREVMMKAPKVQ